MELEALAGTLRPWNRDGHSVVEADFVLHLDSAPTRDEVREFIDLHPKLQPDYPGRQVTPEGGSDAPPRGNPPAPQCVFGLTGPGGDLVRDIGIGTRPGNDHVLEVRRRDYRDWETTWGTEVLPALGHVLPVFLRRARVQKVGLRFHHRFVWEGDLDEFGADMVLDKDTPYLPRNVFSISDGWHCLHGYFGQMRGQERSHPMLSAVEVDVRISDPVVERRALWATVITTQTARIDVEMGEDGSLAPAPRWGQGCAQERTGALVEDLRREGASLLRQVFNRGLLGKLGLRQEGR